MRQHPRAVLDPPGHPGGCLPDGGRPTRRAPARLDQVGGHDRARRGRWDLEHLPGVLGVHRHPGKLAPTFGTGRRGAHDRVVGVSHLGQGDAWLAGLLAGLAARPGSQRPVGGRARLLGVGTVGAGGLAGVGGVPARLPLQLGDPVAQDRHLRPQLGDLRVPCRQRTLVQFGLGGDHRPQLGVDRTLTQQRRAQLLDRQGGQVARRLGHGRHDRHAASRRSTRSTHGILSSLSEVTATAFHPR
jgi:hypothetical protein